MDVVRKELLKTCPMLRPSIPFPLVPIGVCHHFLRHTGKMVPDWLQRYLGIIPGLWPGDLASQQPAQQRQLIQARSWQIAEAAKARPGRGGLACQF